MPSNPALPSVFDHVFDVVVFGAGLSGMAAARSLSARGHSTLVVEASGDVLWELGRALENSSEAQARSAEWRAWLASLRDRVGANDRWLDPALAEILTAHELTTQAAAPRVLLYAAAFAVESGADQLHAVIVATKSGPRRLRSRQWIDTTERGVVARLVQPRLAFREPTGRYRSLVIQTLAPEVLDAKIPKLIEKHPGLELFASFRETERRLRWPVLSASDAWHRKAPALVQDLRELLAAPPADTIAHFVVSHVAMNEFPIYETASTPADFARTPANLEISSPALRHEAVKKTSDRFALGLRAAANVATRVHQFSAASVAARAITSLAVYPARTHADSDVLVAGSGTGGAVAALGAARQGARTIAIDHASYPGGIGTGAGICGYFHGGKGGVQDEIDRRVQTMTELMTGAPAGLNGWHHEAKKIVLLNLLDDAGVIFIGDALLTGVEKDDHGRVLAALAVIDGELVRLPAAAFIDGTGDGDLATFAGASSISGRPGDQRTLSYSQSVFSIGQKDRKATVYSCNFDAGWVDPADAEDLSRARLLGIAQHLRADWTQPDRAAAVSPLLGLRQSRQIDTDIKVTQSDLVEHTRFDDSIGEADTVADTHSVDFEFETDEMAFYYWTCRGFRHPLSCELPYRMLLPRGLDNVWLACRAAGIEVDAAYGLRMQRDMHRLGEASGIAAAMAAKHQTGSRHIDFAFLQRQLDESGCRRPPTNEPVVPGDSKLLAALDRGLPGIHLWHLSRDARRHGDAVRSRLKHADARVSFYAAAILALWGDASAEPRLIRALENREQGPTPEERPVPGAFGQCIDLPFWMQSVVLLRGIGTARSLPALGRLATTANNPLNVRTTLALTLERIAARIGSHPELVAQLDHLGRESVPDPVQPPSRSLWRTLHGEPQKQLGNDRGADVAQDHIWQLHLALARAERSLGRPVHDSALVFTRDARAFVRHAFAQAGIV